MSSSAARRALVLGGTGMLGHVAAGVLARDFDVHATVRSVDDPRCAQVPGDLHQFEALDLDAVEPMIASLRPELVVNCLGIVKQRPEAEQPLAAIGVNSLLPHVVAQACERVDARLVHVSTDCVFSGRLPRPGAYTEEDVPDPVDLYGRSKLLGEVERPGAVTLRTSIIGWELGQPSGLLEWAAAQQGSAVRGFEGAWFSGLTTRKLAEVIRTVALEHPALSGLFHVASEPISKYRLLTLLDEALGLDLTIERVREPELNRVLDAARFEHATGISPPAWTSMISEYARKDADAAKS